MGTNAFTAVRATRKPRRAKPVARDLISIPGAGLMEKLKLNIDELKVNGFATVEGQAPTVGTVRGNAGTIYTRCTTDCTDITSCGNPCA
jgi:hypothetical protein